MTENEAKTKTCLQTLAPVASADGSAPWFSPATCIGSACMAWRSKPQWRVRSDFAWQDGENPKHGVSNEGRVIGWCGLAGKP